MRALLRAFGGTVLTAVTLGLLVAAIGLFRPNEDEGGGFGRGGGGQERSFAVLVEDASIGTATPSIEAYGRVATAQRVSLRATASGQIVELSDALRVGAEVEKDAVLLRIDPADATRALRRAEADVSDAEAQLAERRAALDLLRLERRVAETQRDLQSSALERTEGLALRGAVTEAGVEAAQLSLAQAEQTLLTREQSIVSGESALKRAQITLDRASISLEEAQQALADTTVTAPFPARVEAAELALGQQVAGNEVLATLVDPRALEVSFRISNAEFARLIEGGGEVPDLRAEITLPLGDVPFTTEADVSRQGTVVSAGETGRTLFATLSPDAGGILRPGDFVTVRVEEPPLQRVSGVPASAVSTDSFVLILGEEDRLLERPVEIARREGDQVLVRGLVPGDRYVVSLNPQLAEGVRVRPIERATGAEPIARAEPETIRLDPERRARLLAFVEESARMPDAVKARMRSALEQPDVPVEVVSRLEARMGG
jgi:RND family efflux transporter MFP subunit